MGAILRGCYPTVTRRNVEKRIGSEGKNIFERIRGKGLRSEARGKRTRKSINNDQGAV